MMCQLSLGFCSRRFYSVCSTPDDDDAHNPRRLSMIQSVIQHLPYYSRVYHLAKHVYFWQ